MIPLCERTVIAGKYRLERELASGGMGAVWVARHLQLDEPVAVKFMSATLPDLADARARFAREAKAAAHLRSPHVVQVLDHGVDGDVPYIVMELLEGEHLGDRLKRERRLSLRAAAAIATQVGKALGRAHRAGIVHRDLKPANIFLARLDDEEIVKLLDFGIAKTQNLGDEVTSADVLMGSPQYMSPEQARGSKNVDYRADLWSLGAILFRALTGVPAFGGVSAVDVIVQICTAPLPVASAAARGVPPELDAFFRCALAREPAHRFASAQEMTEAFAALVARIERDEPGTKRPRDSAGDLQTIVMPRRPPDDAREPHARVAGASPAEIDAFVERAFGALLDTGTTPPASPTDLGVTEPGPAASPAATDAATPTTRCAPGRSSLPPAPRPSQPAIPAARAVLERLAPGSFGEPPASPPLPTASSLFSRLSGLRALRPDARMATWNEPAAGTVAVLIERGFSALRQGEPDTARRAWKEALGLDPSNRLLELNLRRLDAIGTVPRGRL